MASTTIPTTDNGLPTEEQLDREFPNRPKNTKPTLPFHSLYLNLFNPLDQNRKRPTGPLRKTGPFSRKPAHELRRDIIKRFIAKWRSEVGPDIFPAFRLIVPDKDRDRIVYGLKEKALARIWVKVLGINARSDDALALLNWKEPMTTPAGPGGMVWTSKAGDFAGRVFDVVSKRAMRLEPGELSVADVNEMLDGLSMGRGEKDYLPVFQRFYRDMCAEEIMWMVRMVLRQMKVGASEKTLFASWHQDAEALFKVSSSLRRVCWELTTEKPLEGSAMSVTPMQCFQPQLAQYDMHDFEAMAKKVQTPTDKTFWIEEKLDGERMQLHMVPDETMKGGRRFAFWSRRAKDYTYLYGDGLYAETGSLTRHLTDVFADGIESLVLDGEMIAWDPLIKAMVAFGTLKTAALYEQSNPRNTTGHRPLLRVFDILRFNDRDVTDCALHERRRLLNFAIKKEVEGRFEIHKYSIGTTADDIEVALRDVVADSSEGLVIKNPRREYSLNERNDSWFKVKPEYMEEYGEQLDVVIIGGYYGAGHRGGWFSSFLCGLRVNDNEIQRGADPQKSLSFLKAGGGFTAQDYKAIRSKTEGKWIKWDRKRPPRDLIVLGGDDRDRQYERPDMWIKPQDSLVVSVKASSVHETDRFAAQISVRFPRFQRFREDRDWRSALSMHDFLSLKSEVEKKRGENMRVNEGKKRKITRKEKPAITIHGKDVLKTPYAGPVTECFKGLEFFVIGGCAKPQRKSKPELEQLVKANGGNIHQTHEKDPDMICIADANLVQVNALKKRGTHNVIRPSWIFECIKQNETERDKPSFLLPLEPRHLLFAKDGVEDQINENVDPHGDSFARDTDPDELKKLLKDMPLPKKGYSRATAHAALESRNGELPVLQGWILEELIIAFQGSSESLDVTEPLSLQSYQARQTARFAGATVTTDLEEGKTTHIVVCGRDESELRTRATEIRRQISTWKKLPRVVGLDWIENCWKEKTRIDEERSPVA
ncbi:DNA ligase (ATP) [Thelotrema lepadinum]|nr:DNA ligase (ATP) [Thelotrema lepadinum]